MKNRIGISRNQRKALVAVTLTALLIQGVIWIRLWRAGALEVEAPIIQKSEVKEAQEGQVDKSWNKEWAEVRIEDLTCIGVRPEVAGRILKYLEKGGSIRGKSDLEKMYGISPEEVALISERVIWAGDKENKRKDWDRNFEKRAEGGCVDINDAALDSLDLVAVPGIGAVTAHRILVRTRELGGWTSVDALQEDLRIKKENWELAKKRLCINQPIRTIAINEASEEELAAHGLIRKREARAIVHYRNHHGRYKNELELLKVGVVDSAWVHKIAPYLSY